MKKTFRFKLMLLGLLAMGSTTSFAQRNIGDKFPAGAYVYEVTATMDGTEPGAVTLIGIRDTRPAGVDGPIVDGALVIPGLMTADLFGEEYSFNVTALDNNALQQRMNASGVVQGTFTETAGATTVTFPATIKNLPANCLKGYTNISTISFAANSELETIADGAFATTQITTFDFSNCSQLAELTNAVFVEAAPAVNSYITSITLPENSVLLKHIGTAFQRLSELTTITNLEKSAITEVVADAFNGCAKLTKIELPGTVQTIAASAFANCGVEELTINVGSLLTAGDATTAVYGDNVAKLKKLTLKGDLGGVITANAFKGSTNLETLDLSALNFASKGQIAGSAFEGCNNAKFKTLVFGDINDQPTAGYTIAASAFKDCTNLESVTFGKINSANAIEGNAFTGCTKLATVNVGDVLNAGAIGDGTNPAFGNALKTVKIGTVKAGDAAIMAKAFTFANVKGATLQVAVEEGEYVSSDDASTPIFAADAFVFDAIDGSLTGWVDATDAAVVTFGEIKSKGGVFTAGTVSGKRIREIVFAGDIAQGGIDAQIYDNDANATSLKKITFNGKLAQNAIEANAFANLATSVTTITFNASLANAAVMNGAFEGLKAGSTIKLAGTPDDATVNPFQIRAFDNTSDITAATNVAEVDAIIAREILLDIAETHALYGKYKATTTGLLTFNGKFAIYRVMFAPVVIPDDDTFLAYQNANDKKVAWARINFSADKLSETLNGGDSNLKIQRVQTIDGAKVKLTLYATYTDEDDALNASSIYMVPLKVTNGFYHIAKTDDEIIIAKVEKASDFTVTDVKVPVLTAGYAAANESLWPGLTNTELNIAQNVMTNQQLVDKTAKDGGVDVDIYRGGTTIAEDLYIMTDPAKYKGFRVDKAVITKGTGGKGAYINEGWYYMLLKHYDGDAAAARVIWLDDSEATAIFGVKEAVKTVNNNAIYTLQGVRVSAPVKGQIYIQNGKKFIAK